MKAEFDMGDLIHDITLNVTVIERPSYRLRWWLGRKIMQLAVMIIGCRIEFHDLKEVGK